MNEIGTLLDSLNSLCHMGFIVYVLLSIAEIKRILRDMQRRDKK